MFKVLALAGALAMLALGFGATAARADFSACDSALRADDMHQKIDLYTLCIQKGGLTSATDLAGAFNNRGVAYQQLGQIDQALQDFTTSIQYDPTWGAARLNRALIYYGRGEWGSADADLTEALRDQPPEPRAQEFFLRGEIRENQGRYAEAIADYDAAAKRDHKLFEAYALESWLLATSPDPALRNGPKAVDLGQTALKLAEKAAGNGPVALARVHAGLAAAYAEAGRFDDAIREQSQGIDLLKRQLPDGDPSEWNDRLELYRRGMPFHLGSAPAD